MRNLWLIALQEYRKRVIKRSFLIATLGLPLLLGVAMAVTIFVTISNQDNKPLGYVDHAGVLKAGLSSALLADAEVVPLQAFPDEAEARRALEDRQIQAYYVLPADYLQHRQVSLFYWKDRPGLEVSNEFAEFLRLNLAASLPQDLQRRLVGGPSVTVSSMDGSRQIGASNFVSFLVPFLVAFLFFFTVMTSAGYLLQVVTDEKENRTMEILITSLSPEGIIGGKALGLMAVALTQLGVWVLAIAAALLVGARFVEPLRALQLPWASLLLSLLYFLPAYALIAAMMTAIGGSVSETQQGQQIAGIFNFMFSLPFFLIALIVAHPNSPLLVVFSLFPTTSFLTILLRWAVSAVPLWQLAASWLILTAAAILGLWASARIFRAGMLLYGQNLDLRAAWSAVRSPNA